jgi:hypothetical protein
MRDLFESRPACLASGWAVAITMAVGNKLVELCQANGIPGRDSGVFVTIAQGILRGQLPYRDFWDHKPPGIYYIDALVLRLMPARPSSLHLAEAVAAILSLIVFYFLVRSFAARRWALLGVATVALLSTEPNTNQGGNFTETYALLPTTAAYVFLLQYLLRTPRKGWLFLAGAAIGLSAVIRPLEAAHLTLATLVVAASADLGRPAAKGVRRDKMARYLWPLLLPALGLGAVIAPVLLYFAVRGVWSEMWSQVIEYNRLYATAVPPAEAFANLLGALRLSRRLPFLWLNAVAVFAAAVAAHRSARPQVVGEGTAGRQKHWPSVALLLGGWFFLASATVAAGGRFYSHYFLLTVPPSAALLVWGLSALFAPLVSLASVRVRLLRTALLAELVLGMFALYVVAWSRVAGVLPLISVQTSCGAGMSCPYGGSGLCVGYDSYTALQFGNLRMNVVLLPPSAQERVAAWVVAQTDPGATIQVWGAEAGLYFLTDRRPASRYIYDYPLIGMLGGETARYTTPAMVASYLNDLRESAPAAIVVVPDHAQTIARLPQLANFVAQRYKVAYADAGYQILTPRHY